MSYTRVGPFANDAAPDLDALNMNTIEQGIIDAHTLIAAQGASSGITYDQGGTGAVSRTLTSKLQEKVSVKDFGAVGDGSTDDTAAIQAAIDYAETLSPSFLADSAVGVYFPYGEYLVSSLTLQSGAISLYGDPGRGAMLTSTTASGHTLLTVGDATYASQVYHVGLFNLSFVADSTIANRTDTIAVKFHDAISCYVDNCVFNNWAVSIDGYRFNSSFMTNLNFRQHNRSSANAEAAIRLRGRSTDGNTSGNNHISNFQILGSAATADVIYNAGLQITSVDGLYVTNGHIYKCVYDVRFAPDGTNLGNIIEGVIFDGVYFDEPGTACVLFSGTTADAGGAVTKQGLYQNIQFDNCYFRGAASQSSGTTYVEYLVRCQVDAVSSNGLDNIKFTGGTFRQANQCPFYFQGAASSDVEATNVSINGITATDNNQGGAATYALFSGEVGNVKIANCTAGDEANATASLIQAVLSSTQGAVIFGNDFTTSSFTGTNPFVITQTEGALVHVADNKLPDTGTTIDQWYYLTTSDATKTTAFSYTLNAGQSGYIRAKVFGRSDDVTRVFNVETVAGFRYVSGGSAEIYTDADADDNPDQRVELDVNPSTYAVAVEIDTDDIEVNVTGIAAETIKWSVKIEMVVD